MGCFNSKHESNKDKNAADSLKGKGQFESKYELPSTEPQGTQPEHGHFLSPPIKCIASSSQQDNGRSLPVTEVVTEGAAAQFLRSVGLPQHIPAFELAGYTDFEALAKLTPSDLEQIEEVRRRKIGSASNTASEKSGSLPSKSSTSSPPEVGGTFGLPPLLTGHKQKILAASKKLAFNKQKQDQLKSSEGLKPQQPPQGNVVAKAPPLPGNPPPRETTGPGALDAPLAGKALEGKLGSAIEEKKPALVHDKSVADGSPATLRKVPPDARLKKTEVVSVPSAVDKDGKGAPDEEPSAQPEDSLAAKGKAEIFSGRKALGPFSARPSPSPCRGRPPSRGGAAVVTAAVLGAVRSRTPEARLVLVGRDRAESPVPSPGTKAPVPSSSPIFNKKFRDAGSKSPVPRVSQSAANSLATAGAQGKKGERSAGSPASRPSPALRQKPVSASKAAPPPSRQNRESGVQNTQGYFVKEINAERVGPRPIRTVCPPSTLSTPALDTPPVAPSPSRLSHSRTSVDEASTTLSVGNQMSLLAPAAPLSRKNSALASERERAWSREDSSLAAQVGLNSQKRLADALPLSFPGRDQLRSISVHARGVAPADKSSRAEGVDGISAAAGPRVRGPGGDGAAVLTPVPLPRFNGGSWTNAVYSGYGSGTENLSRPATALGDDPRSRKNSLYSGLLPVNGTVASASEQGGGGADLLMVPMRPRVLNRAGDEAQSLAPAPLDRLVQTSTHGDGDGSATGAFEIKHASISQRASAPNTVKSSSMLTSAAAPGGATFPPRQQSPPLGNPRPHKRWEIPDSRVPAAKVLAGCTDLEQIRVANCLSPAGPVIRGRGALDASELFVPDVPRWARNAPPHVPAPAVGPSAPDGSLTAALSSVSPTRSNSNSRCVPPQQQQQAERLELEDAQIIVRRLRGIMAKMKGLADSMQLPAGDAQALAAAASAAAVGGSTGLAPGEDLVTRARSQATELSPLERDETLKFQRDGVIVPDCSEVGLNATSFKSSVDGVASSIQVRDAQAGARPSMLTPLCSEMPAVGGAVTSLALAAMQGRSSFALRHSNVRLAVEAKRKSLSRLHQELCDKVDAISRMQAGQGPSGRRIDGMVPGQDASVDDAAAAKAQVLVLAEIESRIRFQLEEVLKSMDTISMLPPSLFVPGQAAEPGKTKKTGSFALQSPSSVVKRPRPVSRQSRATTPLPGGAAGELNPQPFPCGGNAPPFLQAPSEVKGTARGGGAAGPGVDAATRKRQRVLAKIQGLCNAEAAGFDVAKGSVQVATNLTPGRGGGEHGMEEEEEAGVTGMAIDGDEPTASSGGNSDNNSDNSCTSDEEEDGKSGNGWNSTGNASALNTDGGGAAIGDPDAAAAALRKELVAFLRERGRRGVPEKSVPRPELHGLEKRKKGPMDGLRTSGGGGDDGSNGRRRGLGEVVAVAQTDSGAGTGAGVLYPNHGLPSELIDIDQEIRSRLQGWGAM